MSKRGPKTTQTVQRDQTATRTGLAAAQPVLGQLATQLGAAVPGLGVSPEQQAAMGQLRQAGGYSSQFLPQVTGLASDMLAGGNMGFGRDILQQNLATTQAALTPYASGAYVDPTSDPVLQAAIAKAQEDARNAVGAEFAGMGRSSPVYSGIGQRALGQGMMEATLVPILQERARREGQMLNAANMLTSTGLAGTQGIDAATARELATRGQGIGVIGAGQGIAEQPARTALEVEAMRDAIPLRNIGLASQIASGLSGTGMTSTGSSSGTTTQQAEDPNQLLKLAIGTGLAGAGLMSGGAGPGMFSRMFARPAANDNPWQAAVTYG